MSTEPQHNPPPNTVDLNGRAMDNIAFIRETMERSASFTAVPGRGMMAMGGVALIGSWAATWSGSAEGWLWSWLAIAVIGCAAGMVTLATKCRHEYGTVLAAPARRFALNLAPPILAGAVLTEVFERAGSYDLMPGTWLLLYGVAVVTAGAFSVPIVPLMGLTFTLLGTLLLLCPMAIQQLALFGHFTFADAALALGFGGLHLVYGALIALRHGG